MPEQRPQYREIGPWNHEDVEQALRSDDGEALRLAVICVSMHDDDWRYAQDLCIRLSEAFGTALAVRCWHTATVGELGLAMNRSDGYSMASSFLCYTEELASSKARADLLY